MTERVWIILAGMLLVLAAVFLWWNNLSAAFVTAALGACAWFLSYRAELRKKIKDNDASDEESPDNIDQE
jgi:uncharacterized membrane protein YdjX (TVP38/TMEM64 family)